MWGNHNHGCDRVQWSNVCLAGVRLWIWVSALGEVSWLHFTEKLNKMLSNLMITFKEYF